MLLITLAVSLLWNILAGIPKIPRQGMITSDERVTQAGEEPIGTSQDKAQLRNVRILMSAHLWTNFKIRKYYQKKSKFNGVCSRNNLPKMKDGKYVVTLDDYESAGTH